MTKMIHTVQGEISSSDLGITLMHEHLCMADHTMRHAFKDWYDEDIFMQAFAPVAKRIVDAGIKSIVDVTPINVGRDLKLLKRISKEFGLNILCCTGFYYTEDFWMQAKSMQVFLDIMLREMEEGIWNEGVKPALIKCATAERISDVNSAVLKASAKCAALTGAPVYTHHSVATKLGLVQLAILESYGVDPGRVVIGHCGDSSDMNYLESILKRGAYIGLDRFGTGIAPDDTQRALNVVELINRGWINQLILSHDVPVYLDYSYHNFMNELPNPEYLANRKDFTYISKTILPILREHGVSQQQIDTMLIDNPRRFFEA